MTGRFESPTQLDDAIDRLLEEPSRIAVADEGELTATARVLRDALPRFHPRFGFEEHLARRLSALRHPGPAAERRPTLLPSEAAVAADEAALAAAERRRRGLVAGGAIASGVSLAIPIAGAAIVVWRRSRSQGGLL